VKSKTHFVNWFGVKPVTKNETISSKKRVKKKLSRGTRNARADNGNANARKERGKTIQREKKK